MRTYRIYLGIAFLLGASAVAAEKPVMSKDAPPKPVSFSASPVLFVADGAEHAPELTVTPAGVSYTTTGVSKASKPGDYSFTATACGSYSGQLTCNWRIVAAAGADLASQSITATVDVRLLLDGRLVGEGQVSDKQRQLKLEAPDHRIVATATFSRFVARDAQGHPMHVNGGAQWKSYGLLKPTSGRGEGCTLRDGGPPAATTLQTKAGTYTLSLSASQN